MTLTSDVWCCPRDRHTGHLAHALSAECYAVLRVKMCSEQLHSNACLLVAEHKLCMFWVFLVFGQFFSGQGWCWLCSLLSPPPPPSTIMGAAGRLLIFFPPVSQVPLHAGLVDFGNGLRREVPESMLLPWQLQTLPAPFSASCSCDWQHFSLVLPRQGRGSD